MKVSELQGAELDKRLTDIVVNVCDVIGCKDCHLKWDNTCSAVELQGKLLSVYGDEIDD